MVDDKFAMSAVRQPARNDKTAFDNERPVFPKRLDRQLRQEQDRRDRYGRFGRR